MPDKLPTVAYGNGSYVFDTSGKQYIDGSGGPAVFCLGHAHPEVNEAIKEQLDRIAHGYRYTFTSEPLEHLTDLIRSQGGAGFEHIIYVSSGSEAMESALKLALQYYWANGETRRTEFIARDRSYHGNTLGALAVSGFSLRREPYENALNNCTFVSAANEYRPPNGVAQGNLASYLAEELDEAILKVGTKRVAGFIFEPVVGAAGGVVPAPPGYANEIREVCDRHGVLMIADEVMCGAGRCGTWSALENDGVTPDIRSLAKGLGGGYVPLGATVFSKKVGAAIFSNGGFPVTGHTFTGHTLACAAAAKVQEIIIRDELVARVRDRGEILRASLQQKLDNVDEVGDIRGRGYFIGVELVQNRQTRVPFDADLQLHERIRLRTLDAGLICYPVTGNVDGKNGDVVILSPPYNASDIELDEIVDKFDRGLRAALQDINSARQ